MRIILELPPEWGEYRIYRAMGFIKESTPIHIDEDIIRHVINHLPKEINFPEGGEIIIHNRGEYQLLDLYTIVLAAAIIEYLNSQRKYDFEAAREKVCTTDCEAFREGKCKQGYWKVCPKVLEQIHD